MSDIPPQAAGGRLGKHIRTVLTKAAVLLALSLFAPPSAWAAAPCTYHLGFDAIYRQIPGLVGLCLDNEYFASNGDALQHASGGLLVWRRADNWTAFTDGYQTWVNGPNGLQVRFNNERFPFEDQTSTTAVAAAVPLHEPESS